MNKLTAVDSNSADIIRGASSNEGANAQGSYSFQCFDSEGNLKWEDTISNLVTTVGKNLALDTFLAGSAYTANVFLGLISSVSYTTGAAVGDTMASHGGWFEVSGTTYFPTVAARRRLGTT